jgi:hypothetical protein
MQNDDQGLRGAADGVPRRLHYRQTTVTEHGLALGAGTLLAKMGDEGLRLDGEEERILTLLAIAYRGEVPDAALGTLRRVAKHWQGGRQMSRRDSSGTKRLAGYRRRRRLPPVAGGRADRRGRHASR